MCLVVSCSFIIGRVWITHCNGQIICHKPKAENAYKLGAHSANQSTQGEDTFCWVFNFHQIFHLHWISIYAFSSSKDLKIVYKSMYGNFDSIFKFKFKFKDYYLLHLMINAHNFELNDYSEKLQELHVWITRVYWPRFIFFFHIGTYWGCIDPS